MSNAISAVGTPFVRRKMQHACYQRVQSLSSFRIWFPHFLVSFFPLGFLDPLYASFGSSCAWCRFVIKLIASISVSSTLPVTCELVSMLLAGVVSLGNSQYVWRSPFPLAWILSSRFRIQAAFPLLIKFLSHAPIC